MKIVYDKVDILIAIGDTNFSTFRKLRDGKVIGVKVIPLSNTAPANAVNIGVNDSQSQELVSIVDFRDYKGEGGGYLESLKPVNFQLRGEVNILAQSTVAIAGTDFNAQLIFAIDISNCEEE